MTILLILLIVVPWSISRQMRLHAVTAKGLIRLPIIFAAIGLLGFGTGTIPTDREAIAYLAVSAAVSLMLGLARGVSVPMWTDADGELVTKGNRTTLSLWVALIVTKVAMGTAASITGVFPGEHPGEIFLFIALSFVAQNIVVARRAGFLGRRVPAVA